MATMRDDDQCMTMVMLDDEDDYDSYSSGDDDYRPTRSESDNQSRSDRSDSEDDGNNGLNFNEYVKRVNAVKVTDQLSSIFDNLLRLNIGMSEDDHRALGELVFT